MQQDSATAADIVRAVEPLRAAPATSAVFSDLDGTLAPIVERPADAAIPGPVRELLARIAEHYGLAGIVSGRPAADAAAIAGLDELTYIGNHGYELLTPGSGGPVETAALRGHAGDVAAFTEAHLDDAELAAAGLRAEDKGAIVALHWRGAADERLAEQAATGIGEAARAAGLDTHRGRKVLELRPVVAIDKGSALAALLADAGSRHAFYAGDDRTDADAFRALGRMRDQGQLDGVLRVAVTSAEGPPELAADADLCVAGPDGLVAVLEGLI